MATSVRLFFREKTSNHPSFHLSTITGLKQKNISQETLKTADNSGQKVPWGLWKGRESKVLYIRYTGTPKGRRKATFFRYMTMTQFSYWNFFARKNIKKLIPYSKTEEKTLSQETHREGKTKSKLKKECLRV